MNQKSFRFFYGFQSIIWTLSLLVGMSACTSKKTVSILNSGENSFAALKILNPYGNDFIVSAGGESGAIGYTLNNETHWVKGTPQIAKTSETETTFTWDNKGQNVVLTMDEKDHEKVLNLKLESNGTNPSKWFLNTTASANEYFTGIFERVVDGRQTESWKEGITAGLNLRGQKVDVKLKPTVSAYAPFYISSQNYGLFVHGTWPGVIDFCKEKSNLVQIEFEGPDLTFSLYTDENPANIVKHHTMEAGPAFLPPKWAFGPWRWRDEHLNEKTYFDGSKVHAPYNSQIVEDVLMMQAYDIPFTAYWIDRPWGPGPFGYDDFKIDQERLPNFQNMIHWLNNKNAELMLWIGPFVMGDMANYAEDHGYQLISKSRRPVKQVLMDFTNEEACKWWAENGPAKLAAMGVKGFKLDRADGEKLCDSLNLKTSIGTTYRENYNDFPRQYVKATYDAVHPILGDDMILFPRAQYTGSQKYGGMWAGDTGNPQEGLRSVVIGMQRCAVMGYPIWGSDTGGYPKHMQREVAMRWLGFSCFSPIMEVGPTDNKGFWGMDYEPSYDKELMATWRFYSKVRMSLQDYIYQAAKVASETGMPIARPLFLEYPNQPESWKDWTTYKFGDDLLVSIIWENGKTKQSIYLPAGETWVDLWNHKEYEGGQTVEVDAPLYQTSVFLRKGSALQLPDFNQLYKESVEKTSVQYKMSDLEAKANWKN